jgi:NADPH-dependent 7-cyano-7-deazaguanine reductase QueF-like protein
MIKFLNKLSVLFLIIEASFFKQFIDGGLNYDLNVEVIENASMIVRQKKGVSVEECARLCLTEPAFTCSILTYSDTFLECKWTSIPRSNNEDFITIRNGYTVFVKDPLYNYFELPSKVTSLFDYINVPVKTAGDCAAACDSIDKIRCRSFNLCANAQDQPPGFTCLMSETNFYSSNKDPALIQTIFCSHYSS